MDSKQPNIRVLASLVNRYNALSKLIKEEQEKLAELGKSISSYVNGIESYYYGSSKKSETK